MKYAIYLPFYGAYYVDSTHLSSWTREARLFETAKEAERYIADMGWNNSTTYNHDSAYVVNITTDTAV